MNSRRGFTLLEILVVAAVLTLLLSLLFPAFAAANAAARKTQCLANMKQIAAAVTNYAAEFSQRLPLSWTPSKPDDYTGNNEEVPKLQPFSNYRQDLQWDTATPQRFFRPLNRHLKAEGGKVVICPSDQGDNPDDQLQQWKKPEVTMHTTEFSPEPSEAPVFNFGSSYWYADDDKMLVQGISPIIGEEIAYMETPFKKKKKPPPSDPNEDPYQYEHKPHPVYTIDYWTYASKKVFLMDWDATLTDPNRPFWHYPDSDPPKVHAAFLDGSARAIELNKYIELPEAERVNHDHVYY